MADEQAIAITNKDVKTSVDHNTTMIESMFHILQDIQCQNIKIEKRIGGLESDMHSLRTKSNDTSKRTSPKVPNNKKVDKEFLKASLTEMSVDVKSFVKTHGNTAHPDVIKDNMAQLEKRLMTKLDGLKTSQGNTNKKVNQMAKEVQGLNETIHGDMSAKLSGLIRCSAHGSIKLHQEMEALTATAETSRDKLSSEMKSQTSSLKSNQNTVKQVLTNELHALQDVAGHHTVELQHVKDLAQSQNVQLGTVAHIVQNSVPYKQAVMLKGELKGELKSLKEMIQTPSFLKRNYFSNDGDYGKYVENNARVGMKVRLCVDTPQYGIVKGDIGTVTSVIKNGLQVDWSPKDVKSFVFYVHELIG